MEMEKFKLTIKMDSATEFVILPYADPLVGDEFVSQLGDHAESDISIQCNVSQNSTVGKRKDGLAPYLAALFNNAREFFLSPLDENRQSVLEDNPDICKQLIDCFGMLAFIDNNHFGDGRAIIGETYVERYAKPILASLRFAKSVAYVEQSFYKLDDLKYDIHFDFANRNVIISKSPGYGILGWLRKRSSRGYWIANLKTSIHLATINIHLPRHTTLQNAANRLQNAPNGKDAR